MEKTSLLIFLLALTLVCSVDPPADPIIPLAPAGTVQTNCFTLLIDLGYEFSRFLSSSHDPSPRIRSAVAVSPDGTKFFLLGGNGTFGETVVHVFDTTVQNWTQVWHQLIFFSSEILQVNISLSYTAGCFSQYSDQVITSDLLWIFNEDTLHTFNVSSYEITSYLPSNQIPAGTFFFFSFCPFGLFSLFFNFSFCFVYFGLFLLF